jgi:leucyl/phenylalanyl-tRNA---protein transferase
MAYYALAKPPAPAFPLDTCSAFSIEERSIIEEMRYGYSMGYYMMADGYPAAEPEWYGAPTHTLLPIDGSLHIPTSLRRVLNQGIFKPVINGNFEAVITGCRKRPETWISDPLATRYRLLHKAGIAHSFETYTTTDPDTVAGGILGIVLGKAFIGESMFFSKPDASKVALVLLCQYLATHGFVLFDAQLMNPHLARFGAYDLQTEAYKNLLNKAIAL